MTGPWNSPGSGVKASLVILLLASGAINLTPAFGGLQRGNGTAPGDASRSHARVSNASVWRPPDAALKAIRSECGHTDAFQFGQCFIKQMGEKGASANALAFAGMLQAQGKSGAGYMKDFTEGGRVAVAHVVFPRSTGSREAWLLVNGSPSPIDVDDLSLLPLRDVRSDIVFQEIRRTFSKAALFGDPRQRPSPPLIPRAGEAQEFLVDYGLHDGCGDCKRVGSAQFAFDFADNGRFEGATLRGVWMTADQGQLAPVSDGQDFHIHLLADHSAGYTWQLASPVDERFVALVSTTFSLPGGKLGSTGVEDWIFHARAAGRTIIRFQKVRPGEKSAPRDRRFFFVVTAR